MLRASLASGDAFDRQRVEAFFSGLSSASIRSATSGSSVPGSGSSVSGEGFSPAVRLVQSAVGPHHFGNTPAGFKSPLHPRNGDASGCVIHIVNASTVLALSSAAGLEHSARRFTSLGGVCLGGQARTHRFRDFFCAVTHRALRSYQRRPALWQRSGCSRCAAAFEVPLSPAWPLPWCVCSSCERRHAARWRCCCWCGA
jgi:hypothetical protein